MSATDHGGPVNWYRIPIGRENLSALNRKSDLKGGLQTVGYLAVLAATGTAAFWSAGHWPWYATAALLYLHGTCYAFLINGFHELIHDSVFRTRPLNRLFLYVFSFLGWYNPVHFWASHTEHHKFTLHPPDDLEVVLPVKLTAKAFMESAVLNPLAMYYTLKTTVRHAAGRLEGQWEHHLFSESKPELRRQMFNWARVLLVGHAAILAVAVYYRLWMLPVVVSLASFYGGALQWLCNNAQHAGLRDNVPDFRLCCRTIYLNPVVQFLYWHMNYHTEHHMYAGVPCYHLGRLHRLIKDEMPPCPNGLVETWRQIIDILRRQKADPTYQYAAPRAAAEDESGTPPCGGTRVRCVTTMAAAGGCTLLSCRVNRAKLRQACRGPHASFPTTRHPGSDARAVSGSGPSVGGRRGRTGRSYRSPLRRRPAQRFGRGRLHTTRRTAPSPGGVGSPRS